jgi:phage/plasmid primase-like uncharacterized protein
MNILELVREYGFSPKKEASTKGGEYSTPCPSCGGDDRFRIWPNDGNGGGFWCRKCEKNGDNIDFCKDFLNMSFKEACEKVGRDKSRFAPFISSAAPKGEKINLEQKEKTEEERLQRSRAKAAEIWINATTEGNHTYFDKKGIDPVLGVRYGKDEKGNDAIVVPYRDTEGTLQAVQFINGNSPPNKFFAKDTMTSGSFFTFGCLEGAKIVYLCEGIATAASIWISENKAITTLSCGAASNITKVAKAIRKISNEIEIRVCLDDDKAGNKIAKDVADLGLSAISFRRPDFTGLQYGEKDKDFNDVQKLAGIETVKRQLQRAYLPPNEVAERDSILSAGKISIESMESYYQNVPPGVDIGLKAGDGVHDKILIPSGAYSVFCAPTKHGKTAALVNAVERHLWKDSSATAVFITLEELDPPVSVRFLSRFLNENFSKNNALTLASYFRSKENRFSMFSTDWKRETREGDSSTQIFQKNVETFNTLYLKSGRLRILSFNSFGGILSQIEQLCKKIEEFKKWTPGLRMVAIDYLQLLGMQKPGNRSRDEVLKEVCLQLKDVAAKTGLVVLTAAQFNRTIQNEDDLHPSAIGEAGSIERHAALAIGMWNRRFNQMSGGKVDQKKEIADEILLNVMLNRHGPSGQRIVAPYNGNVGLIDFESAKIETDKKKSKDREQTHKTVLF